MAPCGYALAEDAVHVFTGLRARQRAKFLRIGENLARAPRQSGDWQETGASGRNYELKLFDNLLITWWVDHAAREVRIIRIEAVD